MVFDLGVDVGLILGGERGAGKGRGGDLYVTGDVVTSLEVIESAYDAIHRSSESPLESLLTLAGRTGRVDSFWVEEAGRENEEVGGDFLTGDATRLAAGVVRALVGAVRGSAAVVNEFIDMIESDGTMAVASDGDGWKD